MSAHVLVFGRRQRRDTPQAQLAGVQKAPRHEVAGSWARARQRALWGFNAYRGTEDSAVGVSAGVKRRNGRGGNPAERLQGPRPSRRSKAICAAPLCEVLSPCRGRRTHHVQKDYTGSWEIPRLTSGNVTPWPASGRRGAEADDE